MGVTRRAFLTYVGMGTYALLRGQGQSTAAQPAARRRGKPPDFFKPIQPSRDDRLILPPGFDQSIICRWNDPLGTKGPRGAEHFGFNNDFLAYFPIDALKGGKSNDEGLLFVNHEYADPLFVSGYAGRRRKTVEQIQAEKLSVGASVIQVARKGGKWIHVPGSRYTRRLTASYPMIDLTGPASKLVPRAVGTLANCSGGRTPWFTALSCEENFQYCNLQSRDGNAWADVASERIDEQQYGWVVEIDPFGDLPPAKHSALGRFAHENTAWRLGPTNRLVIYMGDDAHDQFLYKYVSSGAYQAGDSRQDKQRLLTEGMLYAADLGAGRWRPLDLARSPELRQAGFKSQGEVLLRTREAAAALKATPLDRPEDCEVHPRDGTLYIALSNSLRHGNFYGQIVHLLEDKDNPEGESFRFEIFLAGGPQSGLACPDNLAFDRAGNLWVVCDMPSDRLNKGAYATFGNNGLYFVPTQGPSAGDAFQFASGPIECELAGPWFTENEDTLFLSVQHPGEESTSLQNLTSHWPDGGKAIPRPSVLAITGFRR
jgi:secreted PhoX family phosphatase